MPQSGNASINPQPPVSDPVVEWRLTQLETGLDKMHQEMVPRAVFESGMREMETRLGAQMTGVGHEIRNLGLAFEGFRKEIKGNQDRRQVALWYPMVAGMLVAIATVILSFLGTR